MLRAGNIGRKPVTTTALFPAVAAAHVTSRPPVTLITGAHGNCGIADYARQLRHHLSGEGIDARIVVLEQTGLRCFFNVRERLGLGNGPAPIIHLQYPLAQSNGLSLYLLACLPRLPFIVTLHEYSVLQRLRQLSFVVFALFARAIFFTTEDERALFLRRFPWAARKTRTVPIGSNIPLRPHAPAPGTPLITTFSLIRPGKGLEQFVDLARQSAAAGLPWRFQVIGARSRWFADYAQRLLSISSDCEIDWRFDLSAEDVCRCLAQAHAAYMPFPDGASERRGSLLAVLGNGLPTVTRRGPSTSSALEDAVAFAATPAEAVARLQEILGTPGRAAALGERARRYARRFSWEGIAAEHAELYRHLGAQVAQPA
jgi:glycosyltransferase involved in cell wall biosynthesis